MRAGLVVLRVQWRRLKEVPPCSFTAKTSDGPSLVHALSSIHSQFSSVSVCQTGMHRNQMQPGFIASPYLFNRAALSPIVCRVSPHSLGPALDSFSVLDRAVACMRGRMKAIFFMFKLFDRPNLQRCSWLSHGSIYTGMQRCS